ncbi:ribulose-phosphate 3-epimerase [Anaerococcus provencensis]|uniref:ribulose-phosphate 3-epimerase n=1 Tax=Anaerococcus provencensis TaxID=938293 RepID=UPI0002F95BBB|nr:ribulose-phosphate 3-epimerase [Anaerococcus provencensis]
MQEKLLFPSMMCADFRNLEKEVKNLEEAGVDSFHIDIMDGSFVPNFGMGMQDLKVISNITEKSIDVHLMIDNPGRYIDLFVEAGANIIYVHPESDNQLGRTINKISDSGKKVGLAINPATSIETIKPVISLLDYVMVMTVNPGFAGQSYEDYVDLKIKDLVNLKSENSFKVIVDGAISPEKVKYLSNIGVDGFVLGTSSLFGKDRSYSDILSELRGL